MKTLFQLALIPALLLALNLPARADTQCSVLTSQQAFAVSIALDMLMDGGQKIELLNDSNGNVRTISQAVMTPVLNGYTVSVFTSDNQWEQLDIGHITAINETSGRSVKLASAAGCNP
ncbi:MAG: hypothetical protein ACXVB9_01770 [Bdellovibrionota bacterium]